MVNNIPKTPIGKGAKALEDFSNEILKKLDPHTRKNKDGGMLPFWGTGARSFIKLGGKPLAICMSVRWTVSYNSTPIHTIDTVHPWDIDVGPARIDAVLANFFDPTKGPESFGLFHTMKSAIHQPFVEMQVLDRLGTCLFFARGMFTSISGSIEQGQLSNFVASFSGVAYQHYVAQNFQEYGGVSGAVSGVSSKIKNLASKYSGGIL